MATGNEKPVVQASADYFMGLQHLLVCLHYQPQAVSHQMEHHVEHLLTLLPSDDAEDLLHYYGIFGHEQLALHDLARRRNLSDEDMMSHIDASLRRLAVTPEWQIMKQQ